MPPLLAPSENGRSPRLEEFPFTDVFLGDKGRGCGIVETVVPIGVVTLMALGSSPAPHSILYPGGRNVLKPWIRLGLPANKLETRSITPGVSILTDTHISDLHCTGDGTFEIFLPTDFVLVTLYQKRVSKKGYKNTIRCDALIAA